MKKLTLFVEMGLLFTLVYSTAMIVPIAVFFYLVLPIMRLGFGWLLLASPLAMLQVPLLLLTSTLSSGLFSRILRFVYSGTHALDFRDKDVRKWLLSLSIYLPTAVVLDFLHIYPLKTLHISLFGGKVANTAVVGGLVMDPSLFEIGDHSILGGFATVLGHAVESGNIRFDRVRIGRRCEVGTHSLVLPGATMEDGSTLAAHSFLAKDCTIQSNQVAWGVPAKGRM